MSTLAQLVDNYVQAVALETAAFNAIEGEGTDEQWDKFITACSTAKIALNDLLVETSDRACAMIKGFEHKRIVAEFFTIGISREGEAREKSLQKAFELAALESAGE